MKYELPFTNGNDNKSCKLFFTAIVNVFDSEVAYLEFKSWVGKNYIAALIDGVPFALHSCTAEFGSVTCFGFRATNNYNYMDTPIKVKKPTPLTC